MSKGWKTATSVVLTVVYAAGLLMNWWTRNTEVELFLAGFFSVGAGHKVVKYRKSQKEKAEQYDNLEDLIDHED